MSYIDPGPWFVSEPTHNRFVPRPWIADGIRRSVADGTLEPGTPFVTNEDYMKMMQASETVAYALSQKNYKAGKISGLLEAMFLVAIGLIFAVFFVSMSGCSTARPTPRPSPTGPVRVVSTRVQGVSVHNVAYLLVKFSDSRKAWPVRVVEAPELEKMAHGTQVLMVRVTDTAAVAQEIRGPRPGEAAMKIMMVP